MDFLEEKEAFEKYCFEVFLMSPSDGHFDRESEDPEIYESVDTHRLWTLWQAKAQAVPEGFILVPKDQFESMNEFKDLYKRAITNARKRKGQLNWAHVVSLGVGSSRAMELCKTLNIDPSATNMHEGIEAQEQGHE